MTQSLTQPGTQRPSAQQLAEAVVAALISEGVRDVLLSPGSRSAPLAYALLAAERAGALRVHVVVDERSAGFQALGLAVATARVVPIVVTSGSAVVNLHPAVLEAAHQRVGLLVISCDRPAELVQRAASQTTEHLGIFGAPGGPADGISRPRASAEVSQESQARSAVGHLLAAARGPRPGPVHLNLPLADPLVPVRPAPAWPHRLPSRAQPEAPPVIPPLPEGPRTVVVAGDGAGGWAGELAAERGWPLLAEPSSGARIGAALSAPTVLLDVLGEQIERVVVAGRPTLSRQVSRLLARTDLEVVLLDPPGGRWLDVPGARHEVLAPGAPPPAAAPRAPQRSVRNDWLTGWQRASSAIEQRLDAELADAEERGELAGWSVARQLSAQVCHEDGVLLAGASMAIRELDLAGVTGARVVANRGLAGIDGTVSTGVGHALAAQHPGPVRVLLGDLTLQHDLGGLVRGRLERPINLQLVVLADDGGSIFATLEHGRAEYAADHERVFATPQRLDLAHLARAVGARHHRVHDGGGLRRVLAAPSAGVEIVEAVLVRHGAAQRRAGLQERLRQAARGAVGERRREAAGPEVAGQD